MGATDDRGAEAALATSGAERTIAAIATARGGPVGIVRVSGPGAAAIGAALCAPWPEPVLSHHLYYGRVRTPAGAPGADSPGDLRDPGDPQDPGAPPALLDQVLFCLMRAPRSFTGEDVLEIHAHGGAINLNEIYEATLRAGAAPAQPGEFSLRAFLHGKLDLTQAESVAGLIGASSRAAARHARRQLDGALGRHLRGLRERVLALLADLQGALDFPELEPDPDYPGAPAPAAEATPAAPASVNPLRSALQDALPDLLRQIEALLNTHSSVGRALERGVEIALCGRANAGKSSLLNSLCGRERALVDAAPGTTRDYIEVATEWEGYPVRLVDTAGLRDEAEGVERRGLRQQRARLHHADLILLVVDGCEDPALPLPLPGDLAEGTPVLVACNKSDALAFRPRLGDLASACGIAPEDIVPCSALCGWGLSALRRRALARLQLGSAEHDEALVITSARQAEHLREAAAALAEAADPLLPWDLALESLSLAARSLARITGEDLEPQVLDAIFSRFCVGK